MASGEGEEKVMATAQHIVKTLGTTDTMTDDMIHIFSKFDKRFLSMSENLSKKSYPDLYASEYLQEALSSLEERILKWDISSKNEDDDKGGFIWCDDPNEAAPYLESVDHVQNMISTLSSQQNQQNQLVLLEKAQCLLQRSMARLEEEFKMLLEKHSETVDPEWLFDPVTSTSKVSLNDDDVEEEEEEEDEEVFVAQPVLDLNFTIDLIPSEIVDHLHEIAKRMLEGGYMAECCQAYSSIRRSFLEESVSRLGYERRNLEDVQKIEWECLEVEIAKWIQVMKIAVHVFLPSESKLAMRVFDGCESGSDASFLEISRGIMIQLLSFAESVAIGRRSPERLFKLLDMYEILRDLFPEFNDLYSHENMLGDLRSEISTVMMQLAEAARGTFVEFENAIQRDTAKVPVPGGAVHPLTRYVMNYMRFACDYKGTLEQVLADGDPKLLHLHSQHLHDSSPRNMPSPRNMSSPKYMSSPRYMSSPSSNDNNLEELSPWSIQTIWIMDLLEGNLESKSKLYKDVALSWLFLMNNCCYILQKVKNSDISSLLGDDWIRKHTSKVRHYHTNYTRAAWGRALSCLKDEGVHSNGNSGGSNSGSSNGSSGSGNFSSGVSRPVLKERFKNFNSRLDDIYKTQSSWIVADDQLRTELRLSIAEMLVPAYRSFFGRFKQYLENGKHPDKYIKFSPEDLESLVNELFEGPSGSMGKRKSQ